jgi:hypothetical protein
MTFHFFASFDRQHLQKPDWRVSYVTEIPISKQQLGLKIAFGCDSKQMLICVASKFGVSFFTFAHSTIVYSITFGYNPKGRIKKIVF